MKKSQRMSLIASAAYVVIALILLSLTKPLLHIMAGAVPAMFYVLCIAAFACPLAAYILIPRIEKVEEEEQKENNEKGKGV